MSSLEDMFNKTYKVINVFIVIRFLFVCLVSKKKLYTIIEADYFK